jgi:hypothetical protein
MTLPPGALLVEAWLPGDSCRSAHAFHLRATRLPAGRLSLPRPGRLARGVTIGSATGCFRHLDAINILQVRAAATVNLLER